jgi:hypothetical protein
MRMGHCHSFGMPSGFAVSSHFTLFILMIAKDRLCSPSSSISITQAHFFVTAQIEIVPDPDLKIP